MNRSAAILSFLCIIASTSLAIAEESRSGEHLGFGIGAFNVLDEESTQFSLEYRGDYVWESLRPVVGVRANADSGVYGYAGGHWDWWLDDSWILSPNFVVGAYSQGDSKDLGGALEFRSGLELDYMLENDHRLGVTFSHISNASIYDHNPGSESLMFIYSLPVNVF